MRTTTIFSLLVAASTTQAPLTAQESGSEDALELRADNIELKLDDGGRVVTLDAISDEGDSGKSVRLRWTKPEGVVVLDSAEGLKVEAKRRWLGVQVGEVPPALRVHLGLEKGHGVMILNIVEDSPADKAGMKQYDVVIAVNGKKVKDGSRKFASAIHQMDDGEEITLELIQAGERKALTATLSSPPTEGKQRFKFKLSDGVQLDRFELRGGVADHSPDGWKIDWTDKRRIPLLGKMPILGRLFVEGEHGDTTISLRDKSIRVEVTEDGGTRVVVIKRRDGPDGQVIEEKKVYDDLDDLEKDAPETYEIVKKLKDERALRLKVADWIKSGTDGRILSRRYLKHWKPDWEEVDLRSEEGEVDRQFKVEKDGRIQVLIKKGKSQVETTFESEEEMKEKEPKLHARFKKLLSE